MLFEISHRSIYTYSQPVGLEPMTLRLRPRSDAWQTVHHYDVEITPAPSGISHCVGLDGNNVDTIWFSGLHEELLIDVHTKVETLDNDPFNYLITDNAALQVPLQYDPGLAFALAPYLHHNSPEASVQLFASETMKEAKHETIAFLMLLAQQIPTRLKYMLREHGEPWSAAETLQNGEGACRDFAVLFMEVCRIAGIAARFVSGYCIGETASDNHMHAWAEVYLPGAGWRGFDPSRGVTTSQDHIAVAASYGTLDAAPTFGNYRGAAVSTLVADISILTL